jgi:cyclopropane-fatty-acyl-phospholipid synthase
MLQQEDKSVSTMSPPNGRTSAGSPWDKRLLARLLAWFGNPPVRLALWNGEELNANPDPSVALVRFRDRATLLKMFMDPYRYFGDAYAEGRIEVVGDLVQLLEAAYRGAGPGHEYYRRWWRRNQNTLSRSKENIHHHYDLGNVFYKLWLDDQLVYTCAYFKNATMSLEDAQVAKMDHVCRKLRLSPGEQVVEPGCGWGSLALHMARHYGVKVRAFNISHEQIAFAQDRARREGLSDRVQFIEDDYRNIQGRYDVFASVGMLEHVGVQAFRDFGAVIDRCLTPAGRGFIHTIGRNRPMQFNPWMDARVFNGAQIPSLSEMMEVFEPCDFCILDVENLRLHYARTLQHWLTRFESVADQVEHMFDEQFVRMWRLYLAGSLAAFTTGWTQLYQVLFNRRADNHVPWTRDYQYGQPSS